MNTRRMTPIELRAIIDAAGITPERAAQITGIDPYALSLFVRLLGADCIPAPISRLLCTHLLALGLATELAQPWVPDDLAEVLAPTKTTT